MNFKSIGYYILIVSLLLLGTSGIYKLFEKIIFDVDLSSFFKILIIGAITGILFLLIGLIIERIKEGKNDNN
ncbi:MAG: hypothetical protein ACOCRX_10405 [Candidatus Woesearchaeota archaeon]